MKFYVINKKIMMNLNVDHTSTNHIINAYTLTATSGLTTGSLNPAALISEICLLKELYASSVLRLQLTGLAPAPESPRALRALAC